MNWLWKLLVWIDVRINDKWLGGMKETISGRLYRHQATHDCALCSWLCRMLDKVDRGHCSQSYLNDRLRDPSLPWV